ncbi:MAG TPA: class I SAM-dependent methyltransferase [Chloroflexota bacterium]|nr:class I SAM-dependent methyltransferase [Chloroflexota bacterium]
MRDGSGSAGILPASGYRRPRAGRDTVDPPQSSGLGGFAYYLRGGPMTRDDVRAYYQGFGEREWTRLATAEGRVEFAVNTHAIAAYLPPGARVLDSGGGPGRYSLWLAERGHRVVLADLSPELLAIARDKVAASAAGALVEEIVEADACDLGRWPDGSFDAALALGPFYHLPTPAERDRAAAELARVLRPAGIAFVALMPRYIFLRRTLALPDERHRPGPARLRGACAGRRRVRQRRAGSLHRRLRRAPGRSRAHLCAPRLYHTGLVGL